MKFLHNIGVVRENVRQMLWNGLCVHRHGKTDEPAKSRNKHIFVIPAKAGIQGNQAVIIFLDPGFHRGDDYLRDHQDSGVPVHKPL